MNLNQLLTFRAVATIKSFQRAADTLHLTQPAVSKQVRALETELRERLFERGRAIRLTHAGELLLKYAERIDQMVQAARQEVGDLRGLARGRLAIGASHSLATDVLPGLLETYRARYQQITLSVEAGWAAEITRRVASGDLDLGLVVFVSPEACRSLPLTCISLATTEIVFVAAPNWPPVKRREVAMDELGNLPWILNQDGCLYRAYIEKLFRERHLTLNVAVQVIGLELQKRLAQLGLGAALLPKPFVTKELREGTLKSFRVRGVKPRSFSCLVYRKDKYIHGAMKVFLSLLQEAFDPAKSGLRKAMLPT